MIIASNNTVMFPFKLNFCQLKNNPYKTHSQTDMKTSCHDYKEDIDKHFNQVLN